MRRAGLIAALALAALTLPGSAFAHAALLRTVPEASGTVNVAPRQVALTYSEAVEPRFAIVSVTDAAGRQQTAGPPRRSPTDADTLIVPLKHVGEGWYLVYWRAISVDGHPVRGAFTFAVGPNAGPAPQFVVPSTSETAATPALIVARWIVFLSMMGAIGLLALRLAIARPVIRRVGGTSLRPVSIAFLGLSVVGLLAIPIYLLLATADFALRSAFSVSALLPLVHASAFGRGYLDLELCFALFVAAGAVAIWVDRPERAQRSLAELLAFAGAAAAAAATLFVPGASGHPSQTAPRGLALTLDWLHLASGSLWVGGLAGLLVLWRSLPAATRVAGLVVVVPRFSNVALGSVLVLIASGTVASYLHLPTLATLWQTSYGQSILIKVGLLLAAVVLASFNLLRTKPGLRADGTVALGAARLLRRLVAGEVVLVAAAVLVAAILSSLPPPSKALASIGNASARVGPGRVTSVTQKNGYRVELSVSPNRAAVPNEFSVRLTRGGKPVQGDILIRVTMLDMEMGAQEYRLSETAPGVYTHAAPALVMVGHWGLSFTITPRGQQPFDVLIVDHATG
ncbi:MAG TPA: copper resistance protein CopC [Gaiellaceae bacterium]|nr:copper resistance protein CopC [Gaiellaceae bacterium]